MMMKWISRTCKGRSYLRKRRWCEKVDSAAERMSKIDSAVKIKIFKQKLTPQNAIELITGSDVVIDGTDNFAARYALNDACEKLGIPWVFASVLRFEGQVSVFNYQDGPNYRDLFPQPPPPELAPNLRLAF